MNAYDLAMQFIQVMGDIDRKVEEKSKAIRPTTNSRLDSEIDNLEVKMMDIKNQLRKMNV